MIHIKSYKTFNEEINWEEIMPIGYYAAAALISNFGLKLINNRKIKKRFQEMFYGEKDLYSNSMWEIKESGNIITIEKALGASKSWYIINKDTRTFEYKSDIYPLKIKLSRKQLDELLEGISFTKEVTESINDCFYDIKDIGYDIQLYRIDFIKKTFIVKIMNMKISDISNALNDSLYRIMGTYNVKIDNTYNKSRGADIITNYFKDGIATLVIGNKIIKYDLSMDYQSNKEKYEEKYDLMALNYKNKDLIIPFKK